MMGNEAWKIMYIYIYFFFLIYIYIYIFFILKPKCKHVLVKVNCISYLATIWEYVRRFVQQSEALYGNLSTKHDNGKSAIDKCLTI